MENRIVVDSIFFAKNHIVEQKGAENNKKCLTRTS